MTGVPYAASTERSKVMTYSYPIIYSRQSAVYKKTEMEMTQWTALTSCFKWDIYLYGLITMFGVIILFLILQKVNPRHGELKHGLRVSDIAFLGIFIPLRQGRHTLFVSLLLPSWEGGTEMASARASLSFPNHNSKTAQYFLIKFSSFYFYPIRCCSHSRLIVVKSSSWILVEFLYRNHLRVHREPIRISNCH